MGPRASQDLRSPSLIMAPDFIVSPSSVIGLFCHLANEHNFFESTFTLHLLYISKETLNIIKKFKRIFQWKFCENC